MPTRRLIHPAFFLVLILVACGASPAAPSTESPEENTADESDEPAPPPGDPILALAEAGVSANADWTPRIEAFDGVEMALVPAGCFMMGSEDGEEDEAPVHEVCFERPFWIDVTEVTNGQMGESGMFEEDDHPRESVTWDSARDHCASRAARLPTEAEWEYAARGPDGLVYVWGNEFVEEYATAYDGHMLGMTVPVGSNPDDVSWVGALDLAGSIGEWVHDLYAPYTAESQVNPQGPETSEEATRSLRGGMDQIRSQTGVDFRAVNRITTVSFERIRVYGFRCGRDYD